MVLAAEDELLHEATDEPDFRESIYFNLYDPEQKIGGIVYVWSTPNKALKSGISVTFFHGRWVEPGVFDEAMAAPGHRLERDDRWIYCCKREIEAPMPGDFDNLDLCGLELRRIEPLKRYKIEFDDGEGTAFAIDGEFTALPYDYADGLHPTPPTLATNRYHRPWRVNGWLRSGGRKIQLDAMGDTDHSWGIRDWGSFFEHDEDLWEYWAFQAPDGNLSLSIMRMGLPADNVVLGFIAKDGRVGSVDTVRSSATFDEKGCQQDIRLSATDEFGRTVEATFARIETNFALKVTTFWLYEGFGTYEVTGHGAAPGIATYAWPIRLSPEELHRRGRWPPA